MSGIVNRMNGKALGGTAVTLLLLLALVPVVAAVQSNTQRENPIQMSDESVAVGADVFFTFCAGCHGRRGDGRGPQALNLIPKPQNLRNAEFVNYLSDERIFGSISGGVRATAMPAFEMLLNEDNRWHVINYVRSLTLGDATGLPNSVAYQVVAEDVENPVDRSTESVSQGRVLFSNYCASCHGAAGDGNGIIAPNLVPAPRNLVAVASFGERPFIDYMTDARIYGSITNGVPGTSMLPWIRVMSDDERWDILNFLRAEADVQRERGESLNR